MIINGALECTTDDGQENENSQYRMEYFKAFLSYFGLPEEEDLGCATMKPFDDASSSNYPQSVDRNWDYGHDYECKVAPWHTQFSIFAADDYKRCVCYYFAPTLEGCLDGALPSVEKLLE